MGTAAIVRQTLIRNIKSPRFYLSALIGVLVLLSERMGDFTNKFLLEKAISQTYSFVFMLNVELSFTVFPFIFAPICTLAGSLSFCEDTAHNFYRPVCVRISKREYIRGRIISSALTGGAVGAVMILLSALLLRAVYPAHTAAMQTAENGNLPDNLALVLGGWGYAFKIAAAYFLGGMALSLFGLACSAAAPNRYVAIFTPLLLFISIHFIMSYFKSAYTPFDLLMTYDTHVPLLVSAVVFGIVCVVCGYLFSRFSRRILSEE